jgi:hypothetical protein
VKKNLFNISFNSTEKDYSRSLKACDPCASECEKVNKKINNRKLSKLKNEEVAHILNVFDKR